MELTLAMGLKYESGPGYSLLPDRRDGQESGFVRPKNSGPATAEPIIDVEAIELFEGRVVQPERIRHFEYLIYDLHAGVVLIPEVGSRLDTVI